LRILSNAWTLLLVIALGVFAPLKGSADEASLRAEITRLQQENADLRAQLAQCDGQANSKDSDILSLVRKLAQQQSDVASLVLGLGGGPLILPEALLRSVVPNEYIILLADSPEQANTRQQVAAAFGIDEQAVLHVYEQALSGFAARLSLAERDRIEARSDVLGLARNGRVFSTGVAHKELRVGLAQPVLKRPVAAHAEQIDVYLFDTGIRRAHRDLQGRVNAAGFSFFDNGIAGEDCAGHGTHVAARIAGNRLLQRQAMQRRMQGISRPRVWLV